MDNNLPQKSDIIFSRTETDETESDVSLSYCWAQCVIIDKKASGRLDGTQHGHIGALNYPIMVVGVNTTIMGACIGWTATSIQSNDPSSSQFQSTHTHTHNLLHMFSLKSETIFDKLKMENTNANY